MTDVVTRPERHVRPPSAESAGEAPGRGRLAGRKLLVVGGGQQVVDAETDPIGNGRAMSLLFAREGAAVAIADKDLGAAQETIARIGDESPEATAFGIEADISSEADVAAMVSEAHERLGGLDGLVCNVGIGLGGLGLANTDVTSWDKTLRVNLRGPMLCCRQALEVLDDDSSIVFISSVAGLTAGSRLPAYDASKAALSGLMRHVAMEGARRGIRANTICPGLIDTPLGRRANQGRPSRAGTRIPFGRMGTGWEVAYTALFLTSDESVYLTGQVIAVDGGMTGF
ncbi:MAG: SDR family oxidoreductase [Actinomycetota bacterium]|nr:SDR family oxidoreductase [Actinomycetota bacterium]